MDGIAIGPLANTTIHYEVSSLVNALRETFAGLPTWSERHSPCHDGFWVNRRVSGGSTLKLH